MITAMPALVVFGIVFAIYISFRGRALKSGGIRVTSEGRLTRVRNAGLIFTVLMLIALPLCFYQFFGFLLGWTRSGDDIFRVVILEHVYASPAEIPSEAFWLWVVKQALTWLAGIMLLRLFWLYRRGILFSAQNVTCIRFQGYCLIIGCFIDLEMQRAIHAPSVSLNPLFMGFMIIFVAWIMDEGRKIQEEQELTI